MPMPRTSYFVRFSILILAVVAASLGASLLQSGAPASADGGLSIYVDDSIADDSGAACPGYDHCYKTINGALGGASTGDGDKIWVDDGTYNESFTISESLEFVSINGPAVTILTPPLAVTNVTILGDDVTFGGAGGADGGGFTILSGSASNPIRVSGTTLVDVVVQNHIILGVDTTAGVLVSAAMTDGGHLTIQDNQFLPDASALNQGFSDLISFDFAAIPPPVSDNVSAMSADIDILNNTGVDFIEDAIDFRGSVFFSSVTIEGNDFTGSHSATSGIKFTTVRTFSTVVINDNDLNAVLNAVRGDDIDTQSSVAITDLRNDGFISNGMYMNGGVHNQSALSIVDSSFKGTVGTQETGILIAGAIDNGSMMVVSNTTAEVFQLNGIFIGDGIRNASTVLIKDATLKAGMPAGLPISGIVVGDVEQGSSLTIDPTLIQGFTSHGIEVGDQTNGSTVIIDANTLIAHEDGAEYCFYYEYGPNNGSHSELTDNTCTGFGGPNAAVGGGYGVFAANGTYFDSSWLIDNNTLTGHANGAAEGLELAYVTTNSSITATNNRATKLTEAGVLLGGTEDNSTATLNGNTISALVTAAGASGDGMSLDNIDDNSGATVNDNIISGFGGGGILWAEVINNSTLDISRNTITAPQDGMEYGVQLDYIDSNTHVTVNENHATGFGGTNAGTGYGFNIQYVQNNSSLMLDGNMFTSHPDGADYGVNFDDGTLYNSDTTVTNNTIAGFDDTGFLMSYVDGGSNTTVSGNTATAHGTNGAGLGISFYSVYHGDAHAVVNENDISGITGTALYVEYVQEGSSLTAHHNVFADNQGKFGFFMQDILETGSQISLTRNTFSGFGIAGVSMQQVIDTGSTFTVTDNVFAAIDCNTTAPYACQVGAEGAEHIFTLVGGQNGSTIDIQRNIGTGFGGTNMATGYGIHFQGTGVLNGGLLKVIDNQLFGVLGPAADAPDYGVYMDGNLVENGGEAYFQNNTIREFDTEGLFLNNVQAGSAFVTGNTIQADSFGAEYGIDLVTVTQGSKLDVSYNTVTDIGGLNALVGYVVILGALDGGSTATFDNNTLTAHADGAEYCFQNSSVLDNGSKLSFTNNRCSNFTNTGLQQNSSSGASVDNGSELIVDGNTFASINAANGVNVPGNVIRGSTLSVDDNNISDFWTYGVYFGGADAGDVTINDNVISADPILGIYGIVGDGGITNGSTAEYNRNTITTYGSGPGIGNFQVANGSQATICDNTLGGEPLHGIQLDSLATDGSDLTICNNEMSGFENTGLGGFGGSSGGSTNNIFGNTITARASTGGFFALTTGGIGDGSVLNFESNSIGGAYSIAATSIDNVLTGSETKFHNNVLNVTDTDYGVSIGGSVGDGSEFSATQNEITGYDVDGIKFSSETWGSNVLIQNNILTGGGTDNGINFAAKISFGAIVNILNNCITDSTVGVHILDSVDTSEVHINENDLGDLAGTPLGIYATLSANTVDGEDNWWGASSGPSGAGSGSGTAVSTNVDFDPYKGTDDVNCSGATATPTASPSPTPSPTVSPTPFNCGSPTVTNSPSPTPTPTAPPTPGGSVTARPTRTPGLTNTPVPSTSVTPISTGATNSPTPTGTPTNTPTPSSSPSPSPCATALGATSTPAPTDTATPTPTPTPTPSPTPSPVVTQDPNAPTPRPTRTPGA
jgi:hypothetical protein